MRAAFTSTASLDLLFRFYRTPLSWRAYLETEVYSSATGINLSKVRLLPS
jgi:hypothetical protein